MPDPARQLRERPRLAVLLALAGPWLAFFAAPVFTTGVPYERDLTQLYHPLRAFFRESVLGHHRWPQWFPHDGLGAPLIGQFVTATFHPLSWLALPLAPATGLKWTLLGASLAGLFGAYRLSRRLGLARGASIVGAWAFTFCGYSVSLHDNVPYALGLATLPWVFAAALGVTSRARPRDAAALAISWGLVLLGGDAQGFAMAGLLVAAAYAIHGISRRSLLCGLSGLAGAVLLSAPEWVPAITVAAESARAHGTLDATGWGTNWALHPLRWADPLVSGFVVKRHAAQMGGQLFGGMLGVWSASLYVGGPVAVLALFGALRRDRRALVLGGLGLTSAWLALGGHGHLLELAWRLVPPLHHFRYPEKYLAIGTVALGPLVALGWVSLTSRARPVAWSLALAGLASAAAMPWVRSGEAARALWHAAGAEALPAVIDAVAASWSRGLSQTAAALLLGAGLAAASIRRPGWRWGLAALAFADLLLANAHLFRLAPREAVETPGLFAQAIHAQAPPHGPPHRTLALADNLAIDADAPGAPEAIVRHLRSVMLLDAGAIDGLASNRVGLPGVGARDRALQEQLGDSNLANRWLDRCFAIGSTGHALPEGAELVQRAPAQGLGLARLPCMGRAYLTGAEPVRDRGEALSRLDALAGGPGDMAFVEGGERLPPPAPADGARLSWRAYEPDRLELETESKARALLVLADSYREGWTATVDGVPAPILPANVALRGVVVPEGRPVIELRYRTPGLTTGLATGLAGLLLCGLLAWLDRRRAPPSAASEAGSGT